MTIVNSVQLYIGKLLRKISDILTTHIMTFIGDDGPANFTTYKCIKLAHCTPYIYTMLHISCISIMQWRAAFYLKYQTVAGKGFTFHMYKIIHKTSLK